MTLQKNAQARADMDTADAIVRAVGNNFIATEPTYVLRDLIVIELDKARETAMRHARTAAEPHTIDLDEMLAWIDRETVVAASSSVEPKRMLVKLAGGYRVELRGVVIYDGTDGRSAVNVYNEAR